MKNNIFLDYANLKDKIDNLNIADIGVPSDNLGWLLISTCDDIPYDFISNHQDDLSIEHIIINPHCPYRKQLVNDYYAQLDWNKLAFLTGYRVWGASTPVLDGRRYELFQILEDNEDEIAWALFDVDRPFYELNEDFLKYFYNNIDWNSMISSIHQEIPSKALAIALENDKIDIDYISTLNSVPNKFVENLAYAAYLNERDNMEQDFYDREDFLNNLRFNPDLLRMCADPTLYTYASEKLKHSVWIDRTAGIHEHFADDEGLWVDYGDEFQNDAESLESDKGNDAINYNIDDDLEL